jgi:penicillin-binding protein 1A
MHAHDPVVSPETAYMIVDMMKAVVERGTGRKVNELGHPAAGKTGTSNGYRDAWFVGYTRDLLCAVWVGRDDFRPIGDRMTGGRIAAPIWLDFMTQALKDVPPRDFEVPENITFVRALPDKGLPARPQNPHSRIVPIRSGDLPPAFKSGTHQGSFTDAAF